MKIAEIAKKTNGEIIGNAEFVINRVANLETARTNEISFIEKTDDPKLVELAGQTKAGCLFVPENADLELPCTAIRVKNPKLAFAKIAAVLHPPKYREPEIHGLALVAGNAEIANDVFIGAFVCIGENSSIGNGTQIRAGAKIGDNVKIGEHCVIHPNVFIEDNVTIGNRVILHAGVIIGADGFGYVRDEQSHVKFPQIGTVIIEDDVEIGANSCVDRGALGATRIGAGTKIDNLVQIAHNVEIGKRVIIAALTGISGSVKIEDDVVLAGQVGIADHVKISAGAVIGAKSAVFPGKIIRPGGVWMGIPVQSLEDYKQQHALIKSLPRLKDEIKQLKAEIKSLKTKD